MDDFTPANTTPIRPTTASATSVTRNSIRTPGSVAGRLASSQRINYQGPPASVRRNAPAATTPHGQAAMRAFDSRRAAIMTPRRDRLRRRSAREERETPRNVLRGLSRALAPTSQAVATSSSSPGEGAEGDGGRRRSLGAGRASISGGGRFAGYEDDDDEDEDLPIDRPRLSLPIDAEDDSDLYPHRSAGLEDENFTLQSIEIPRRALSEQPPGRISLESTRMSDYFRHVDFDDEEVGVDSGFFPPRMPVEDGVAGTETVAADDVTYERQVPRCLPSYSRYILTQGQAGR